MSDLNTAAGLVGPAGEALRTTASIVDELFARIDRVRQRKLGADSLTRAYYFEVLGNIEILEIIDLGRFVKEKPNSPRLKALVSRLDNSIGASLLFDSQLDQKSDLFHLLEKTGGLDKGGEQDKNDRPGPGNSPGPVYENVLQAVSFTVVKTELLVRLTSFSDDELEILKEIQLKQRIAHLLERYRIIKRKMDGLQVLKKLAR